MTEKKEVVRKGYDKIAEDYQADRHIFDNKKEMEEFVNLLPKNARVLDVGCGVGLPFAKSLIKSGFAVVGVDFSRSMLKLARKNVAEANLIKQDMTMLGFRDNSFDGLTASYSIIHVPREKHYSLFRSFHKILKPKGIMLISLGPDKWEGTDNYYGVEMFWSHYDPDTSLKTVKNSGFQTIFDKHIESGGEKHYWILARNEK